MLVFISTLISSFVEIDQKWKKHIKGKKQKKEKCLNLGLDSVRRGLLSPKHKNNLMLESCSFIHIKFQLNLTKVKVLVEGNRDFYWN